MKRLSIMAVALIAFMGLPAAAQNAVSGSASQANNTANQVSASGAIAAGGTANVVFPAQPSTQTIRQSGSSTTRVESAPALGGLAVGGGHPCAWTPNSGQISIIGGGLGASGMIIDEACMLAIMGASTGSEKMYNAALYMMAARSPQACRAMYEAGLVSDCVDKSGKSRFKKEPVLSTRNAAPQPKTIALAVECQRVGNKVTPVVSRKVMDTYGMAAVMDACR